MMAGLQGAGACAAQSKGTLCARSHNRPVAHHLLACTRSGCAPRCISLARAGAAHALVAQANPYRHLERPVATTRLKSPRNARCITQHALLPDTSGGTRGAQSACGSPSNGTQTDTEHVIQQFDHATSVHEVLDLLKDSTATSVTSSSPLQAAALRALARCCAPIASGAAAADDDDTSEVFMVLPALNALVPYAEAELYGQVLPEHTHRAVLAAGLHAGLGALCTTECPSNWHTATHSAAEATSAMAALVEKCQGATASQSAGGVGSSSSSSGSLPSLPLLAAQDSMRLAAALIAAGGRHTLPRPCAALLLHLLSADGVLPLLPDWALQQALLHVLPGAGLPLPDALAVALEARMRTAGSSGGGAAAPAAAGAFATAVSRAAVLRRCGASAVHSQRALLQMASDGSVERLSAQQTVEALAELEACGVREQLAVAQRPLWNERELTLEGDRVDGPFAGCALQLAERLMVLADERQLGFSDVAAALRHLAALRRRLEGLHSVRLCQTVSVLVDNFIIAPPDEELSRMVDDDMPGVWAFLEAASALGTMYVSELGHHRVMRREMWVAEALRGRVADRRFHAVEWAAYTVQLAATYTYGPYFLTTAALLRLTLPLLPIFGTSNARQLGLLYGAFVLRSPDIIGEGMGLALDRIIPRLEARYKASLERLAARTDMPPLAHLNAMLDALEPVVLADPHNWYGNIRPRDLDTRTVRVTLRVEDYLREPLQRFVTDPRVTSERVPRGVAPWDDRQLVRASVELSEELLLESLFARGLEQDPESSGTVMMGATELLERDLKDVDSAAGAGWFDPERFPLVPLPLELRPPPGQRHGMPGGDGHDAEREAYVRSIAPALMTAQRLARLTMITERGIELLDVMKVALAQHQHVGGRRWVTAMGFAIHPAWAEHHFIHRPYDLVRYTDVPAGCANWYQLWYDGTMLPDWASLARTDSGSTEANMSGLLEALKYSKVYFGPADATAPRGASAEVPAATATLEARREMWARKRQEREEEAARLKEVEVELRDIGLVVRSRDASRVILTIMGMTGVSPTDTGS